MTPDDPHLYIPSAPRNVQLKAHEACSRIMNILEQFDYEERMTIMNAALSFITAEAPAMSKIKDE